MDFTTRHTKIETVMPKVRAQTGHVLPGWIRASVIGAGICVSTNACEPPESGNNVNNVSNSNDSNNYYIDCCVTDYGMADWDMDEQAPLPDDDAGADPGKNR